MRFRTAGLPGPSTVLPASTDTVVPAARSATAAPVTGDLRRESADKQHNGENS